MTGKAKLSTPLGYRGTYYLQFPKAKKVCLLGVAFFTPLGYRKRSFTFGFQKQRVRIRKRILKVCLYQVAMGLKKLPFSDSEPLKRD